MNIIFLKLEGVLSSQRTSWNYDPFAVSFIKKLCLLNNTKIVLMSNNPINVDYYKEIFGEALHENCILPIVENVSQNRMSYMKSFKIDNWVKNNSGINQYLIVDDKVGNIIDSQYDHLINIDTNEGMGYSAMSHIINYFNYKPFVLTKDDIFYHNNLFLETLNSQTNKDNNEQKIPA